MLTRVFVLCLLVMGSSASRTTQAASAQVRRMASTNSSKVSKSGFDVTPMTAEQIADAKKQLDPQEKHILLESGTERAFSGRYYKNKDDGVYVSALTGIPLFDSKSKFDSGSGWPSFTAPYDPDHVTEVKDVSHGMVRVEVRDAAAGEHGVGHLGHVFDDGPGGKPRYCINSAAVRFVPRAEFDAQKAGAAPAAAAVSAQGDAAADK